jgi:hypothetical protein
MIEFPVCGFLTRLRFDVFQAPATQAIIVVVGDEFFLFVRHRHSIALAFQDVTDLAFKRLLTAATKFCFVLTHAQKYIKTSV